jgi:hypothetical protein
MTIVSGCDAQMRFQDVGGNWWAVTLQAGAAGGCPLASGPGAVRLSREGAGDFEGVASRLFAAESPLQTGHPYDVEILVRGDRVQVFVDQDQGADVNPWLDYAPVGPRNGRFGLKAFAATVRFEDVQAWRDTVKFKRLRAGSTRIPTFKNIGYGDAEVPCQYAPRFCEGLCRAPFPDDGRPEEHNACNPLFGQLHGFHDSSSQVAEATSNSAFLSGLMAIWKTRAESFTQPEKESLRRAIVANVLYLNGLFQEGGEGVPTGQFAHSEMGRVAVNINGIYNTEAALYALSDFADNGVFVDRALAQQACRNVIRAAEWRWPTDDATDFPFLSSVVFAHLERCSARDPELGGLASAFYAGLAQTAASAVLTRLADPAGIRDQDRDTGRITPWLEGVYEVLQSHPELGPQYKDQLERIATTLVRHLTREHVCDETQPLGEICPANGFHVLPQSSGSSPDCDILAGNWLDMQRVPCASRSVPLPFVHWYNFQGHFQAAAIDSGLLGRLTNNFDLERIATGNLYWGLGLNPGIPTQKVVNANGSGGVWQASPSFSACTPRSRAIIKASASKTTPPRAGWTFGKTAPTRRIAKPGVSIRRIASPIRRCART